MKKETEKAVKLFNQLNKETQDKFLLALEFSIKSQESTIQQIRIQHPDLKINFEPIQAESLKLAVNHG
ncbi:hypothetical protein [Treponema denticola]|uniref:hypothetical protein n=1 Tax=Treponema denticola TaxID=158 RepID=UPI0002B558F1|nr:hypothetical protein [Treponema denticola]EMB43565.1 hypothetical protein HMPREF9730_02378 [Treponema denticola AL-2]